MAKKKQQNKLHFEISAHVVRQLGEELVTDETTAIMELVKNSYDADADWVKISIHTDEQDSRIEIQDDGFGMNYTDVVKGWLFISMSGKKKMKDGLKLTPKGRAPLGDKGLGRLSTQKLGYQLEMLTGVEGETVWHKVSLDWGNFNEEIGLTSIPVNYKALPKSVKEKGSTLTIRNLRNRNIWKKEEIDRFRGQLSQLIFPFKDKRPFDVYLSLDGIELDLDEINDNLRKAAIGRFSFTFDRDKLTITGRIRLTKLWSNDSASYFRLIQPDNGKQFFQFLTDSQKNRQFFFTNLKYSEGQEGWFASFNFEYDWNSLVGKFDFVNPLTGKSEVANPGFFSGEIDEHYLQKTDDYIDKFIRFDAYKTLVKNQIGIRIFRDGFGIKPYGFDQDDWLKLGKSQTSGGSIYNLRPQNVVGYILISTYENINLKEKTDREGFVDSPYSRNFFQLIEKVIDDINSVYEKVRRSYNKYRELNPAESGNITSIKDSGNRLKKAAEIATKTEVQVQTLKAEFEQTSIKMKDEVQRITNNPLFAKESESVAVPLLSQVEDLLNRGATLLKQISDLLPLAKQLQSDADYLLPKIEGLEDQLSQFSELASLGLTAESLTHELYNILDRISSQTDQLVKRMKDLNNVDTVFFVYVEQVKAFTKNIRNQVNHLAPSLKYNREEKQEIRISTFIQDLKAYFEARFSIQKIGFIINTKQDFIIRINIGKLTQIFDNLLLNSEYWLKERLKGESKLNPIVTIEIDEPVVRIYDNGFGVTPEVENTIFQPFVTTKPRNVGRGLGLFITQQILESQGGEIYLLPQRNDVGHRYIFQINFINK